MISQRLRPQLLVTCIATGLAASGFAIDTLNAAPVIAPTRSTTLAPMVSALAGSEVLQRYIVEFAEPALALRNRRVANASAKSLGANDIIPSVTRPNGRTRLDTHSRQALAYVAHLGAQQQLHAQEMQKAIGRNLTFIRTFQHALNGAVVALTRAEATRIGRLPSVVSIVPDRAHALADDISTRFIGVPGIWAGSADANRGTSYTFDNLQSLFMILGSPGGFKGDGIIVGDIDTGYNSLSPSFQSTDGSGYRIINPLGSGKFLPDSDCSVKGISLAGCNDKVIGVYDEVSEQVYGVGAVSVEDTQGHGSHTASTIAGNARAAGFPGFNASISGIAPHANLVIYYACAPAPVECQDSATAASVDQAIADNVDVLNYSISGGARPWNEPVSKAFLAAEEAGIFIAAAAGNTGTSVPVAVAGSANHLEPWVTTVAATTLPGSVVPLYFSISGPGNVPAAAQHLIGTEGSYDTQLMAAFAATTKVVLSPQFHAADTAGTDGCTAYPAGTFANAIALISRGTCGFAVKVPNAIAAGAIAVVISDNRVEGAFSPTVGPPQVSVPVFSIAQADGLAAQGFLAAHGNAGTASLGFASARLPTQADEVAGFSLLGPAPFANVKPDVAAPGVAVLAAIANDGSAMGPNLVAFYDGTSMATPHITGVGALLMGLHPDWTPMEVKSAIMMTATESGLTRGDGKTPADIFDRGSGRVQAFAASQAGLVLNETGSNLAAAYPDANGDPGTLNIATMQNFNCALSCTFTRVVRNTATTTQGWTIGTSGALAGNMHVSPNDFTLAAGATQKLTISVDSRAVRAVDGNQFGEVLLSPMSVFPFLPTSPQLHMEVVVAVPQPTIIAAAQVVNIALAGKPTGSATLALSNPGIGTMLFKATAGGTRPFTWLDQANANYYGWYSTHYSGLGAGDTDYFVADDFTVTGADNVNLSSIVTPGFTSNHTLASFGKTLKLHWRIYADKSGRPSGNPDDGTAAAWSFDTTAGNGGVSVSGDTISLDLVQAGQATALPAGTYWLVAYPELPCNDTDGSGCSEAWAWSNSWIGSGSPWAQIVPPSDTTWSVSAPDNPSGQGLAMTLKSIVPCTLPAWLSLSPSYGAVFADSTATETFTATAAAYAPATAVSAFVCLNTSLQNEQGFVIPQSEITVQVNAKN